MLGPPFVLLSSQKRRWDHVTEKSEKGDIDLEEEEEEERRKARLEAGWGEEDPWGDTRNIKMSITNKKNNERIS